MTAPDGSVWKTGCERMRGRREQKGIHSGQLQIVIENPQLWWPNGYGEQPLYGVKVELRRDGEVLDVWEKRIGLRTMSVVARERIKWGESFCHEVNGVRIFRHGSGLYPGGQHPAPGDAGADPSIC